MWLCGANIDFTYGLQFLSGRCECGSYNSKYIKIWLHLQYNVPKKKKKSPMGKLNLVKF